MQLSLFPVLQFAPNEKIVIVTDVRRTAMFYTLLLSKPEEEK
jgi:hypothetical protein